MKIKSNTKIMIVLLILSVIISVECRQGPLPSPQTSRAAVPSNQTRSSQSLLSQSKHFPMNLFSSPLLKAFQPSKRRPQPFSTFQRSSHSSQKTPLQPSSQRSSQPTLGGPQSSSLFQRRSQPSKVPQSSSLLQRSSQTSQRSPQRSSQASQWSYDASQWSPQLPSLFHKKPEASQRSGLSSAFMKNSPKSFERTVSSASLKGPPLSPRSSSSSVSQKGLPLSPQSSSSSVSQKGHLSSPRSSSSSVSQKGHLSSPRSSSSHNSQPGNPCRGYQCAPGHVCRVGRRQCLPLLPCPPKPYCQPMHNLNHIKKDRSTHAAAGSRKGELGPGRPDLVQVLVKGLSTQNILQKPFTDKLGLSVTNPVTVKSNRAQARNDPLVFLQQSQLQKQIPRPMMKPAPIFSFLNTIRNSNPFFRVKGQGFINNNINRFSPSQRKNDFRNEPSQTKKYAGSQPQPSAKNDFEVIKMSKEKDPVYKEVMKALEKNQAQQKKVVLSYDGFEPAIPINVNKFTMDSMKEEFKKIKVSNLAGMFKKAFSQPMKNLTRRKIFSKKTELKKEPMRKVKNKKNMQTQNSATEVTNPTVREMINPTVREMVNPTVREMVNPTVQPDQLSNFSEEEINNFGFDISNNFWPKLLSSKSSNSSPQSSHVVPEIISRRMGQNPQNPQFSATLSKGRNVAETYKMDGNRRPPTSHYISLAEFDEIRQNVKSG